MELLKGWDELLASAGNKAVASTKPCPMLPKSCDYFAGGVTVVRSAEDLTQMVEFCQQRPITHIGVKFGYGYSCQGVAVNDETVVYDPRSIKPMVLALTFVEQQHGGGAAYRFVVCLNDHTFLPALRTVFKMPVPFVGHDLKPVFFCLWKLGLPEPSIVWDTQIAQIANNLGRHHANYFLSRKADVTERIQTERDLEEEEAYRSSLRAECQRHGLPYIRRTDTKLPLAGEITDDQIHDLAEEAAAAAHLYPRQVMDAIVHGNLHHLENVEMAWTCTNARIEWNGVKTDAQLAQEVAAACEIQLSHLEPMLEAFGITNVRSQDCLIAFFKSIGLLELFNEDGGYSFKRKRLALFMDRHEAIPIIYAARQILDIQNTGILDRRLIGADGRLHPYGKQLGTHTGRQVARWPNILGVSRLMRPLVIPEPGFGVGEIDLSQIEVFIVAAEYNDETLIQLCNAGDVYVGMVKKFHSDIPECDRQLSDKEFKAKHGEKRDRMKILTLGIIYGSTPYSIAPLLKISVAEAERVLAEFMAMFKAWKEADAKRARRN